jgi:hypothetical protein
LSDYGIKISKAGVDVRTAKNSDLILNLKYPFTKLDSTRSVSFQNITILFTNDPPNGDGLTANPITTTVYRFSHGYSYVPRTWLLFQQSNSTGFSYGSEGTTILQTYPLSTAQLTMQVDDTYVYINVMKIYGDNTVAPANIQGYNVKLRVYVFAENVHTS